MIIKTQFKAPNCVNATMAVEDVFISIPEFAKYEEKEVGFPG